MNQSAKIALCSLLMVAASAANAQSVDANLPNKAQVVREWSAGIRSNAIRAAKEINRDAINAALNPAALKQQMSLMLSDSSIDDTSVAMVTRMPVVSPQAD
ncbi:hypothetical protein HPT27_15820 [Permianibacter sp. IMCC34836]|uniref:hypothetical protein n=1 Tax=Permianibacter fluminis TaxID=2738515 RepID=UPI00155397F6|nr:hypothetical protein [Permianibacter fluminis]NQD38490.1 hypothetical protein [Permianibacter fluminis]